MSKHTLTIKDWLGTGAGNLKTEVGSFGISKQKKGSVQIEKLTVTRKSDTHSSRFSMLAHLHSRNGYQNMRFPEATLSIDKFSANKNLIARQIFDFTNIGVTDFIPNNDGESITFIFDKMSEFAISDVEVL